MSVLILSGSGYKDKCGEPIHFKKPYFDMAMRRKFNSAAQKAEFMNTHGIVQNGDSDAKAKREKKEHYEKKMDTRKKGA